MKEFLVSKKARGSVELRAYKELTSRIESRSGCASAGPYPAHNTAIWDHHIPPAQEEKTQTEGIPVLIQQFLLF